MNLEMKPLVFRTFDGKCSVGQIFVVILKSDWNYHHVSPFNFERSTRRCASRSDLSAKSFKFIFLQFH